MARSGDEAGRALLLGLLKNNDFLPYNVRLGVGC